MNVTTEQSVAKKGERRRAVLELAKELQRSITALDVERSQGISKGNAYVLLSDMAKAGLLERVSLGRYKPAASTEMNDAR